MVIGLASVAGLWLASIDARTDDTGIEAGLLFLIAAALSAVRSHVALLVGAPIPIVEAMRSGSIPAGIAALGFSVAGAIVGASLGIVMRRSASSTSA
jgi:hypothetical protein